MEPIANFVEILVLTLRQAPHLIGILCPFLETTGNAEATFGGQKLGANAAADNMAQREMRKVLNKWNPIASSVGDAARRSAAGSSNNGYSYSKKFETLSVTDRLTIAEGVKESYCHSLDDYNYQKVSQANANLRIGAEVAVSSIISYVEWLDTTTHYIFYYRDNYFWEDQAKDDKMTIESFYGVNPDRIKIIQITSPSQFISDWNAIGSEDGESVNIGTVVLNTHANPQSAYLSTTDINELIPKEIDFMIMYGCNAGHLSNLNDNPAAAFSKKVSGSTVLASDGTVYAYRSLWLFGSYIYESRNDDSYKEYCQAQDRDNQGWLAYEYQNENVVITGDFDKKYYLKQMLIILEDQK